MISNRVLLGGITSCCIMAAPVVRCQGLSATANRLPLQLDACKRRASELEAALREKESERQTVEDHLKHTSAQLQARASIRLMRARARTSTHSRGSAKRVAEGTCCHGVPEDGAGR